MDAEEVPAQQEVEERGDGATPFSARRFYQGDPLLVLLKDRWRLNIVWMVAGVFVLAGLDIFSYITIFRWQLRSDVTLGDVLNLLLLSIAFTLVFLIYVLLPSCMAEIFNTLRANGVIGRYHQVRPASLSYEQFVEQVVLWANSRWWLGIVVILNLLVLLAALVFQPSHVPLFWQFVAFLLGYVPLLYILYFVLLRVILLIVGINRLFLLFTMQVKPLHADGSGGLGSLGLILWVSVGMIVAMSLAVVAVTQLYPSSFDLEIILAVYSVSVVALVIGWLVLPHRVMVQARTELLQPLTQEYERAIRETMPSIRGDTTAIVAGTERLAALQKRYEQVRESYPTWPIEIVQMRGLAVVLILPVLISLLPALFDVFTKK
jgi:hypothetical protein